MSVSDKNFQWFVYLLACSQILQHLTHTFSLCSDSSEKHVIGVSIWRLHKLSSVLGNKRDSTTSGTCLKPTRPLALGLKRRVCVCVCVCLCVFVVCECVCVCVCVFVNLVELYSFALMEWCLDTRTTFVLVTSAYWLFSSVDFTLF